MAFDINKFDSAPVDFPTKKIPVPQLKAFFKEDETPEWEIKALTGIQIATAETAGEDFKRYRAAFEAIAGGTSVKSMKSGFDELLNRNDAPPDMYLKWIKYFQFGSVPECPEHIVVKIAYSQGGLFKRIVHEILIMSAMGADLGK